MDEWFETCVRLIAAWCEQHRVPVADVQRVLQIQIGARQERVRQGLLQCPQLFFPGLRSQPWYDKNEFDWTRLLEANFAAIMDEFQNVYAIRARRRHRENDKLAPGGVWGAFYLHNVGQAFPDNLALCPETAKLVAQVPGAATAGSVFFATLSPHSVIAPHYGPHNFRTRCHMGLIVPDDCFIAVGGVRKSWAVGECIVFDDSFIHHVENRSDRERIVLIVDVWHPDLSAVEVRLLEYLLQHIVQQAKQAPADERMPPFLRELAGA
jgi:aspartyl/asparaginyl beta-hydroxylase (cupin superfamily)